MDYEILQKDPLFWHNQTNEIYWLMGRLGQLERERERERDAIFPCISLLLLIISCNLYICGLLFVFRFEVKMLKIEVATLRISIEQDLYDM